PTPAGAGLRTARHARVAVGDEAVLVVPRQRPDRAELRRARRVGVAWSAQAVARGQAGVGRLGPGRAAVEREVDARHADARRERAGVGGAGVTRLHVDLVVRAGDHDVRPVLVDRQRRLLLLVLRKRAGGETTPVSA